MKFTTQRRQHTFPRTASFLVSATLLLAIFTIQGCSENPVTEEHHSEPVGLVVLKGGEEIVRVEGSTVTGSFELTTGELSPHYVLKFIDEDGDLFVPDDHDFTPYATVGNETMLQVERDDPDDWDFHLRGLEEGVTSLKLGIFHGSHTDYVSPEITVSISHDGTHSTDEPEGIVLKNEDGSVIALIHHGDLEEGTGISVRKNEGTDPISAWLLTHDEEAYRPEDDHLVPILVPADPAIAEVIVDEENPWVFIVHGLSAGSTTLWFRLMHETDIEFEATGIPVTVL